MRQIFFAAVVAVSFQSQADVLWNCKGQNVSVQVSQSGDDFTMTVNNESFAVSELQATSGPIVAFGDAGQRKVLMVNLHNRNSKNEIMGTYRDSAAQFETSVSCP